MISIYPIQNNIAVCPNCSSEQTTTQKILFPGIHVVAECQCVSCQYEFIQDLPVGHACYYPISIGLKDKKVFDLYSIDWYTRQFAESSFHKNTKEVDIERIVKNEAKDIILINCLDFLYGHVLLKLFNIPFYKKKYPEKGLVVIVPSNYKWLVPDYVDEIWVVNMKLSQLNNWYTVLDQKITSFVHSFVSADLAYNYPHPSTESISIDAFTQTRPFDLSLFAKQKLTVTFIYRTDRLWHQSALEYYCFLIARKTGFLDYARFAFPGLQNRYIRQLEKKLRMHYPDMIFNVAGIAEKGGFPASVTDLRSRKPNTLQEKQWCEAYASSHVVVGIHGSNMLLPTAHAAAFVELLPMDRTGNLTQDIITRYEGRKALYLGRFIPDTSSPELVAKQIDAIYKGWPLFELYNDVSNHFYERDVQSAFLKKLRARILSAFKNSR